MTKDVYLYLFAAALALASYVTAGATPPGVATGKALFDQNCARCHDATGDEDGDGPSLRGLFKNKTLPGTGRPTTDANVRAQILNGGGGMPPFKGTLSEMQVDALIAYLKTL